MSFADTVIGFHRSVAAKLTYSVGWNPDAGRYEPDYVCDDETMHESRPVDSGLKEVVPPHSMFFARQAARETKLPREIWGVVETKFSCSCEILYGYEGFMCATIADLARRGNHEAAENLGNRFRGFWDTELWEAIKEVCGGDPEALEILQKRFEKWQKTDGKKSAETLNDFLKAVGDPLVVSVARECLRRRGDWHYCGEVGFGSAEEIPEPRQPTRMLDEVRVGCVILPWPKSVGGTAGREAAEVE